jgi:hypothetical protein
MKKLLIVLCLALIAFDISAEEIVLRKADDLRLEQFSFQTMDSSQIFFWSDLSSGHRDIYCQKVNYAGQIVWDEPIPIVTNPGDQMLIGVTPSSDHNFVLLWADYEIDTVHHMGVQKVSSNGQRLWGENGIQVTDTQISYPRAHILSNGIGGAFVAYMSNYDGPLLGQNFDSYGNRLWQSSGLVLVDQGTSMNLDDAVIDGAGGFILNVRTYLSPGWENRLIRYSPTGTQIGSNPLIPVNTIPGGEYHILPPVNGQYVLYKQPEYTDNTIYMNKIDADGNILLPQSAAFTMTGPDYTEFAQIANYPDGGVVISWIGGDWGSNADLYLQRFSAALVPVWPQPVSVYNGEAASYGTSLQTCFDGKVWINWSGTWENQYSRAQIIDSYGVPIWQAGGKLLCAQSTEILCFPQAVKGIFLWNETDSGFKRIQLQVIGMSGSTYYPPGGTTLQQKLNGYAYSIGTYALGDRWLSLWIDNRDYSSIYYQLLNQNMEPLLESGGRRLNNVPDGYTNFHRAALTPDGKLALIYSTETYLPEQTVYNTFLQVVDSNGDLSYTGNGIVLPSDNECYLSCAADAIYLGWTRYNVGPVHQVIAQKYVNGSPMWGAEGKVIASAPLIYHIQLKGISGSYYYWNINSPDQTNTYCRALRIDANGDPAPGWTSEGIDIIVDNGYQNQSFETVDTVGNDLVTFIRLSNSGSYGIHIQRINPLGERLWGEGGHSVSGSDQWMIINDVIFGENLYFLTTIQYPDDTRMISFRHVNPAGQEVTPPEGNVVVPSVNNCYDPVLVRFTNGSFLCVYSDNDGAWIQNRDVFMRHISPSGIPAGNAPILLCGERYQQDHIAVAAIGNQAFVTWADARAGIMNSEETWAGIWGNMVSSAFSPNSDPQGVSLAQPVIEGNYPNPFNPSTTISFSLPASSSVSLSVYNLKGQLVRTLLSNTDLSSGKHSVIWDGLDNHGRSVSSGVYFCRLSSGSSHAIRKMLLAK